MILASPKGKAKEEEEPAAEESSAGDDLAREAFAAVQDGDEAGFVAAFKAAVKACADEAESYDDED